MHPILKLSPQRPAEYHRGLAHGLQLACEQLTLLTHSKRPVVTTSVLRALHRRLQALDRTIRTKDWEHAHTLLTHQTAPPVPVSDRPFHVPFLGRAAAEDNGACDTTPDIPEPRHAPPTNLARRSR